MIRTGVRAFPVAAQCLRHKPKLLGQPGHRHRWHRHHIVRDEPQPRQSRNPDDPEPVRRTTCPRARIDEPGIAGWSTATPETYARCAECHEPLAAQLTYPTGKPGTAIYVCTGCGKRHCQPA
jgi:hypothetical protein